MTGVCNRDIVKFLMEQGETRAYAYQEVQAYTRAQRLLIASAVSLNLCCFGLAAAGFISMLNESRSSLWRYPGTTAFHLHLETDCNPVTGTSYALWADTNQLPGNPGKTGEWIEIPC